MVGVPGAEERMALQREPPLSHCSERSTQVPVT